MPGDGVLFPDWIITAHHQPISTDPFNIEPGGGAYKQLTEKEMASVIVKIKQLRKKIDIFANPHMVYM